MSWAVVVPSCRPERLASFLVAWEPLFVRHGAQVVVVDDTVDGDIAARWGERLTVLWSHARPEACFPSGTDQCRSLGFWWVYRNTTVDYVLSLDDDVTPADADVFAEYEEVFRAGAPYSRYLSVGALTSFGGPMRGFPRWEIEGLEHVVVQWGGWHGVLDYYAETQLGDPATAEPQRFSPLVVPVPADAAVTGCAMNMAFRRAWTPCLWQLPLYEGRYNRWGDIWSGLLVKRVADEMVYVCVVNGRASVVHDRASDPHVNLAREEPGHRINDGMWDNLVTLGLPAGSIVETWEALTDELHDWLTSIDPDYAAHFLAARDEWLAACAG